MLMRIVFFSIRNSSQQLNPMVNLETVNKMILSEVEKLELKAG